MLNKHLLLEKLNSAIKENSLDKTGLEEDYGIGVYDGINLALEQVIEAIELGLYDNNTQ